ncbi:MAG: exodeoxyribonuclease VII large subunit, partial [Bacteroidota bacterium]
DFLQQTENNLETLSRMVRTLDPANTLRRGFAIVEAGGKAVTGIEGLQPGMRITTRLSNGNFDSTIDHINGTTA